jgi:glutamate racemase
MKKLFISKNVKPLSFGEFRDLTIIAVTDTAEHFKDEVDSLVLGCTHYPFISNIISNYLSVPLIDMGKCIANELNISNEDNKQIDLYFSDINNNLKSNISKIINDDFTIQELIINK